MTLNDLMCIGMWRTTWAAGNIRGMVRVAKAISQDHFAPRTLARFGGPFSFHFSGSGFLSSGKMRRR
jgi:hypothetical protein